MNNQKPIEDIKVAPSTQNNNIAPNNAQPLSNTKVPTTVKQKSSNGNGLILAIIVFVMLSLIGLSIVAYSKSPH